MNGKLFVVLINECYLRDTQVVCFDCVPESFNDEELWDYVQDHDDCWGDCFGGIFVDVVRAKSDDDAIDFIADLTGYDKRILTTICISEN